jgi:hypothetical protein
MAARARYKKPAKVEALRKLLRSLSNAELADMNFVKRRGKELKIRIAETTFYKERNKEIHNRRSDVAQAGNGRPSTAVDAAGINDSVIVEIVEEMLALEALTERLGGRDRVQLLLDMASKLQGSK